MLEETRAGKKPFIVVRGDHAGRLLGQHCERAAGQGIDLLEPLGGGGAEANLRGRGDQAVRGEEPRHQDQADLVREDSAVRRPQDGAAGQSGARHLLRRAGPGRVHGERLPARPLGAQLGGRRAVGEGGLDLSGQALRPAAGGLDRRTLLQQEDHGGPRRERTGELAALARRIPRHGQEGEGQGHHADGARRRRPALSRRSRRARGAAEAARRRRLCASCSQASCPGAIRAWSTR